MATVGVIELAIPCDEVTVEVTVVPEGGLTPFERATLGAIGGGRTSVDDIGTFLGTPRRLVIDVLHGLWARGHVAIDFASGSGRAH